MANDDQRLLARQRMIQEAEKRKAEAKGEPDDSAPCEAVALHTIHTTDADGLPVAVAPGQVFPTTEKELEHLKKTGAARLATAEESEKGNGSHASGHKSYSDYASVNVDENGLDSEEEEESDGEEDDDEAKKAAAAAKKAAAAAKKGNK